MSIEISGPKGYDFQYLNTLLMTLEYLDEDTLEVYVEKDNSEDAQITYSSDTGKITIDIQVKNRSADIDLPTLSSWISHFEKKSSNSCLLKKLEDENRYAIFITDARSNDDVHKFALEQPNLVIRDIALNNNFLVAMKDLLKNALKADSELNKSRVEFLKTFFDGVSNAKMRLILSKIGVCERFTDTFVTNRIGEILNKKYFVPQSKLESVIVELIDKVRTSRGSNRSITSELLQIIESHSGKNILIRNDYYVLRSEKITCKQILDKENVLLLTGLSFCGKTFIAKDIAQEYLESGYKVMQTSDLYGDNGALTFIRQLGQEDQLLIYEDPFGLVETSDNAASNLSEIRNLIRDRKSNKKIIITSRKDILMDTFSQGNIKDCSIDNAHWIDLSNNSTESSFELWKRYYGNSDCSNQLFNDISNWLENKEHTNTLQIGHITNIYNRYKGIDELLKKDLNEIINTARIDSLDLARVIEKRSVDASQVFITLGMCCSTNKVVSLNDFLFVFNNHNDYPGIYKEKEDYYSTWSLEENEIESSDNVLEYATVYRLEGLIKQELIFLKQHGYIEVDQLKRIKFTHPIYHYASYLLIRKFFNDPFEVDFVISKAKSSLGSYSKDAALCTLNLLESLYDYSIDSIKELMLFALDSIFPSVRDKVIMFFDRRINDLSEHEQNYFASTLIYGRGIKKSKICWHNGLPHFDFSKNSNYRMYFEKTNEEYARILLDKIEHNIELTSEEMWNLLNTRTTDNLPLTCLKIAMQYEESFIRSKAIRMLFQNYAFLMSDISIYLNRHEHPDVIYNLFRGALDSWLRYKTSDRQLITNYFKRSLDLMSVSIRAKKFLENFEDEHSSDGIYWESIDEDDKAILWETWHDVFVEFLSKFPSRHISMDEGHMVLVIENSLNYIKSTVSVVELATAWFSWLNRYLQYHLPHDYGMSVADYLMDGTQNDSESRKDIFKLMLSTENTSFITYNVKVFIDSWELLSPIEKNQMIDLLKENRKDSLWIKAISISRSTTPTEIQQELFGEILFDKSIDDIVDTLKKTNLLEPCLNIYCGYPQPLWWNGYHHHNRKFWNNIIIEVLGRSVFDQSLNIAVREFVDLLYNHEHHILENMYEIYETVLLKNEVKRKLTFERLLYDTIDQNQSNKKMWDLLFENSTENELDVYFERIADDIELVQYWQSNEDDLFELFDHKTIFTRIIPKLEMDKLIFTEINTLIHMIESLNESKKLYEGYLTEDLSERIQKLNESQLKHVQSEIDQVFEIFNKIFIKHYETNPPRMSLTNTSIQNVLSKYGFTSQVLKKLIEKNRIRLIDATKNRKEKYDDHYELTNWFYAYND